MGHVLLLEDEAPICMLLTEALTDAGHTVTDTMTQNEAMEALARQDAGYRLLVTDINVGVRGWGFEFARLAAASIPDLPVIYITGDAEALVDELGMPGSTVLPKPFAPFELVRLVDQVLAARAGG